MSGNPAIRKQACQPKAQSSAIVQILASGLPRGAVDVGPILNEHSKRLSNEGNPTGKVELGWDLLHSFHTGRKSCSKRYQATSRGTKHRVDRGLDKVSELVNDVKRRIYITHLEGNRTALLLSVVYQLVNHDRNHNRSKRPR